MDLDLALDNGPLESYVLTPVVTLFDFTYDDPDLKALGNVAGSEWEDNLKQILKDSRLLSDCWALGLPDPDAVKSVTIVDDQYLCVRAGIVCDESINLASILNPSNKHIQQLKIRSITLATEPLDQSGELKSQAADRIASHSTFTSNTADSSSTRHNPPPMTTVFDYHRSLHIPNPITPPFPSFPPSSGTPFKTLEPNRAEQKTPETGRTVTSWAAPPPVSPSPALRQKMPPLSSSARLSPISENTFHDDTSVSSDFPDCVEDATKRDLEEELREEFECILKQRMAELQAKFNQEKFELETQIENLRPEFETLLVQRLAEVQADFDRQERRLKARIIHAEKQAEREHSLPLGDEEQHSDGLADEDSEVESRRTSHRPDFRLHKSKEEHTYDREVFAARLEASLLDRRHGETRRRLQETEERLADSTSQLKHHELALARTKGRLAEACSIKNHSGQVSGLHLRAMELRVAMFERRVIESETQAVWLIRGLQAERQRRQQAEADLSAEKQRRRRAEAAAEATACEAEWPFVVPGLLGLFLKLEGMVEEVAGA